MKEIDKMFHLGKSFFFEISYLIKKFLYLLINFRTPNKILVKLPYYSQWETKTLVKKIIRGEIDARFDRQWRSSGAKTEKEYINWSFNACGMACLKMILKAELDREHRIVDLGRSCLDYGGYKINGKAYLQDDTQNSIAGLYYEGFVEFVRREFGIFTRSLSPLTLEEIIYYMAHKSYVIVSVSEQIRFTDSIVKKKGGHLVLVTGYDVTRRCLYIHNPSGFYGESQQNAQVTFKRFLQCFARRGITIERKYYLLFPEEPIS